MNNNDTLGTQNCKLSQADPFFDPHITIFGNYLYVDKTKNRQIVFNSFSRRHGNSGALKDDEI